MVGRGQRGRRRVWTVHELIQGAGVPVRVVGVLTGVETVAGAVHLKSAIAVKGEAFVANGGSPGNVWGPSQGDWEVVLGLWGNKLFCGGVVVPGVAGAVGQEEVVEGGSLMSWLEPLAAEFCAGGVNVETNLFGQDGSNGGSKG
ncbi:hypothetical protein OGATHE_000305 [Ogataea polymorpha]|uniref:Uncharacterized protein n=1 Tax=Ogataea polymorpha TaxID=460523 RepID=A0A9P8PSV8_9ASCO|nr:hypothetical protein OGATHE_000305 [Ogataea polymorpha]